MKKIIPLSSAIILLAGLASPAYAGSGWRGVCQKDSQKLCQTFEKGAPLELFQCLQENGSQLTFECKKELEDGKRVLASAESACNNDSTKFCATISPGKGNWMHCLQAKGDAVSSFCRDALAKLKTFGL